MWPRLAEMKAVQLVKHDTDSCKSCRRLAEWSRLVWLQSGWTGSCEQVFLGDGRLDRTTLACGGESLGGYWFDSEQVTDTTWWRGRISSQAATWSTPTQSCLSHPLLSTDQHVFAQPSGANTLSAHVPVSSPTAGHLDLGVNVSHRERSAKRSKNSARMRKTEMWLRRW